jgi:alpha-tubulin suppressor-like RCC1 family protein
VRTRYKCIAVIAFLPRLFQIASNCFITIVRFFFQYHVEQPTFPPPPPRITTSPTTLSPTSEMPSERPSNPPDFESCEWFFWGADEARGGILDDNQKVPYLYKWPTVIDLSSGSRHIFIIDQKGIAQVAGFVESKTAYRGHLGIKNWVQGSNGFTTIDEVVVYDNGTIPETVPAPRFIRVFAGAGTPGDARAMHSILISEDGEVFTMGNNDRGQLCLGDQDHRFIPHNVPDLPGPAVAASVGLDFTLILLQDGQVFGCGSNQNGEIGLGQKIHHSFFATQINIGNTTGIVDVSTGWAFSLFQDAAGLVFGTGSNLFSQMCKTTEGDPIFEPELIQGVTDVQQIFAGSESSYFLQEDGSVKACGRNDQGQLGDGSFFQRSKPVNVKIPKGEKIRLIGSGPSAVSVFFVGEDLGLMFAAGINDRFQLGLGVNGGNVAAESVPTEVDFGAYAEMFNFTKVSASGTNTAAIACMLDAPTTSPTAYPTDHPTANP